MPAPTRSWRSLLQQYRSSLKPRELEELPDLLFCRPPAFLLAKMLARTPVTPDQVSFFAAVWSLVVGYGYARGDTVGLWLGSAAYFFWNVLDCVDGQLARLKKQSSPIGYIIDQVVDQISTVVLFVGIAIGLARSGPSHVNWWLVTAISGVLMGIECGVLEAKRHEWLARVYRSRTNMREDLARAVALAAQWRSERSHQLGRFVVRFYQLQRWLQTTYLPKADRGLSTPTDEENVRFARYHRKVLRMAVWLGPTMQMCVMIACALAGHIDYYLWAVILVGVPWMIAVHLATFYARWQERREAVPAPHVAASSTPRPGSAQPSRPPGATNSPCASSCSPRAQPPGCDP